MTYPYSVQMSYGQENAMMYNQDNYYTTTEKNPTSAVVGGAVLGGIAGTTAGFIKNPYFNNNNISDSFAKSVCENYMESADKSLKDSFNECNNIIKNIDKVKDKEGLKNLLNENPNGAKEISKALNESTKSFLNSVDETNLSKNKDVIKEKLEATNNLRIQNIKNKISDCWNKDTKKFENKNNIDENLFEAIKKSKNKIRTKQVLIFAGIAAVTGSLIGFIIHKLTSGNK